MATLAKYDFKGIKRQGANGIKLALLSNPSTAWLAKAPGIEPFLEFVVNWLANNGLVLLNIGAIYVNGNIDQRLLDRSIEDGLKRVELNGSTLNAAQIKEIDDEVIKAADRALPYVK